MSLPNLAQLGLRNRAVLRSVPVKGPLKLGPAKSKSIFQTSIIR